MAYDYQNDPSKDTEPTVDGCHHSRFDIYINGQYTESAGNKAAFAARAVRFYRSKNRNRVVTWNQTKCALVYCTGKPDVAPLTRV